METKFKIGDLIYRGCEPKTIYKIEAIFVSKSYWTANWESGYGQMEVEDCYVCSCDGKSYVLSFCRDYIYELYLQKEIKEQAQINICPRCKNPLKEKMSIGLGEMIKKCSNPDCGWC